MIARLKILLMFTALLAVFACTHPAPKVNDFRPASEPEYFRTKQELFIPTLFIGKKFVSEKTSRKFN